MVDPLRDNDPARVGRYRLLGRLGAGGMGVVYLAENRKGRAALKLIRRELADDASFRSRFRREVQASFRVSGMCTARLIDFDTEADQPWMATEYVDGPPLDSLVNSRGPLGPDQQLALAVGLAEALVAIHEEDVVHRDLKPANVLCPDTGPKIIDFGVATAADAVPMTQHGIVIGSPGWITPEQLLTGEASPASDVFAWGCITAFAASAQQPYGSGRIEAVFWRVINQPPFVDRQRLIPPLRDLVDAATVREPDQRPSATVLLERLLEVGYRHERGRRARTSAGPLATEPLAAESVVPDVTRVVSAGWVPEASAGAATGGTGVSAHRTPAVPAAGIAAQEPAAVSLLRDTETGQHADPVELIKGANVEVEVGSLLVDLMWSDAAGGEVEVAAVLIDRDGKALDGLVPVDRRRTSSPDGSVTHIGHDRTQRGWRDRLQVDLRKAPEQLGRVLVTATLSGGPPGGPALTFADVAGLEIVVGTARAGSRPVHFVVPPLGQERALLAVEIYRRRGRWRVRAVAQGYAEGRAGLARDYGVVR